MSTTIRVSKRVAEILEEQKKLKGLKSIEEVIINLLKERKRRIVEKILWDR